MTSSSTATSGGERKFAVLLFADLSGYTELCQRLDPEDVVATVHPVMRALRSAAEDERGVICTTAGDGFLAVFGVPTAVEDAPRRALSAAQQMREIIASTNAQPRPTPFPPVHIGIAAGEMLVVPSDEPAGFSLVGPAINLASRLCDSAAPGEIVVDEQCRQNATHSWVWAGPRALELKGHRELVRAWTLESSASLDETPAAPPIAFVGRTDLLDALDAVLESAVRESQSGVVHIDGEPGIGKSRLVEEWLRRNSTVDAIWLQSDATIAPVGLRGLLERLHADPSIDAAPASAPERDDPFPAVLAATRRVLAARERPLVVVVDDAHDADPALMAVVNDVRTHPLDAAVVVVTASRSGERYDDRDADYTVTRLDANDTAALVTAALDAEPSPELREALLDRTGGHPLMTLQSVAYLVEGGGVALSDESDERVATATAEALSALPSNVRLSVAARLDRLPIEQKSLLQRASTCGSTFDTVRLAIVAPETSAHDLDHLTRRGLLDRRGEDTWSFAHGLVHDVAYHSLPRSTRCQLHRRQLSAGTPDLATRCFHALAWAETESEQQPDERRMAVREALTATLDLAGDLFGTQAGSAYAAIRRAVPILDVHGEAEPELAARVFTFGATCLLEMWRFDEAEAFAQRAVAYATADNVPASAALDARLAHATALSRARRFQTARQILDDIVVDCERTGDDVRRGRALRALADTWRQSSYPTMVALDEHAFAVLSAAGDVEGAAAVARLLAYLTSLAPAALCERWLQVAQQLTPDSDIRGTAVLAGTATMAAIYRLDMIAAQAAATRAVELGERLGAYDVMGDGLSVLVDCAVARGDFDEFRARLSQYTELGRRTGNPRTVLFSATCSALGLLRMGRREESDEGLDFALTNGSEFGSTERAEIEFIAGLVARDRGEFGTALAHLARARSASAEGYFAIEALLHRVHEARISVAAGTSVATSAIRELVRECSEAGAPYLASYAAAVLDQALLAPGNARDGSMLEEHAIRTETAAMIDGSEASWAVAARTWQQLGCSIWLARAQLRSGDESGAEKTLDLLGADDAARAWVSG